jgi:HSP20 family protein
MSVLRYDPFREFDRLAEMFAGRSEVAGVRGFPMDAYRRGDRFYVHLDLPGVVSESIDLTCEESVLTIQAERRFEQREDDEVIVSERPQGAFRRQLFLSEGLDQDQIKANYENGVLTLEIPVAERAKPRRIQIGSPEGGPQTIEGTSTRQD